MLLWKKRNKDIDLVLSSSGPRAPCFVGGIEALKDKGFNIKRIAGSSGGAIIAAGYALGISLERLKELAYQVPYADIKDFHFGNLLSTENPSLYSGKTLDAYLKSIYGDATISDFKIDCKIAVVTIIERKRVIIDKDSHPNLPVWKAVRMSSTIPFIFPYYKLDGVPVTDGALVTSLFDMFPKRERPVIGLRPRAELGIPKFVQRSEHKLFIWNYIKVLAEYFIDAVDNQHVPQGEWNRTIVIPTLDIRGFTFELTDAQVTALLQYGYDAVMNSDLSSLK